MEYRRMGRTGLKVSEICLGTMTFGHGTGEEESRRIVDAAVDAGVNFFDTANSYGEGESEVLLGKALEGRRDDAVVATKFFNPMGTGPNDSGMSRLHVMQAVEASLRRLRMDHVDLYYIHHVDTQTPLEEMLRALDDLVRQGKVRDIEQELVPLCLHKGLGVVVWSPLGGGFLTGKYRPGERTVRGTRSEEGWAYPEDFFAANADESLQCLLEVAAEAGRTPSQVALRWALEQPAVTSVIAGARTLEQFADNVQAAGWTLDPGARCRLEEVSHLPDRYPEAMEKNMHERRDSAVKRP